MGRKWTTLALTAAGVALLAAGLSPAVGFSSADDDEEKTKTGQIMEKVNKASLTITKGVRTSIAYAKSKDEVAEKSKELVALAKEARELKESAEAQKKPYEEWTKLMDEFIAAATSFSEVVGKSSADQAAAKMSYREVAKSCTTCHEVFRVEDDF